MMAGMDLDRFLKRFIVPLLLLLLLATAYNQFFVSHSRWLEPGERGEENAVESVPVAPTDSVRVGERFASLAALDARQKAQGWLRVGLFGDGWPGGVVEVMTGEDGIDFVRANGTPHRYKGFDGYRMQLVRLQGDGELLVVYRSRYKRG